MEVRKIYFDMYDVLADFSRGVREMVGIEPPPQDDEHKAEEEIMWAGIRDVGHFYDKLEIAPGAKEMFDTLYAKYGSKCEVLTAIPKDNRNIPEAKDDKKKWMSRMLSKNIEVKTVYKENKPEYCFGLDCILIDDNIHFTLYTNEEDFDWLSYGLCEQQNYNYNKDYKYEDLEKAAKYLVDGIV